MAQCFVRVEPAHGTQYFVRVEPAHGIMFCHSGTCTWHGKARSILSEWNLHMAPSVLSEWNLYMAWHTAFCQGGTCTWHPVFCQSGTCTWHGTQHFVRVEPAHGPHNIHNTRGNSLLTFDRTSRTGHTHTQQCPRVRTKQDTHTAVSEGHGAIQK